MGVVRFMLLEIYAQEQNSCMHWIGGCVIPRAILDAVERKMFPLLVIKPKASIIITKLIKLPQLPFVD
jgi:hypothetical protein